MALVGTTAVDVGNLSTASSRSEGGPLCSLTRILLAFVHLFLELPRFFLIHKTQGGHTLLQLEGMKESAVLVVLEAVIDLLVPYHTAVSR